MFAITKLTIANDCLGRKVLKDNVYEFIKPINLSEEWLYGKNITITAIVGKNGSGKSTIFEQILRILNNFCAILCQSKMIKDNPFRYILNVNASIEFIFGENNRGSIRCSQNLILLKVNPKNGEIIRLAFGHGNVPKAFELYNHMTDSLVKKLVDNIFYCIGINYAPFAFNSKDFERETCLTVNNKLSPDKIDLKRHNWMDATFHKNDGYFSNLTLVPFRNRGVFDSNKESKLAQNRILELLISHPDFIEGYRLKEVRYYWNEDPFKEKFSFTTPSKENGFSPRYDVRELIQIFENNLIDTEGNIQRSVATIILQQEKSFKDFINTLNRHVNGLSYQRLTAFLYLVYKVLSCSKYPSISVWTEHNITDLAFDIGDTEKRAKVVELAKSVFMDHSHITIKIDQTKNFLDICDNQAIESIQPEGISLSNYWELLKFDSDGKSVIEIARHLPPPFLVPKIYLQRIDDGNVIELNKLSAGERQFYNTTSSIAYHIMNLLSISDSYVRFPYHRALILLDEIELCFHPEYQRTFISSLTSLISRLGFNRLMEFHFIITTHSPFILSDIPKDNILYLRDGHSVSSCEFINPFGANINDILSQSFFLDKDGFMGEQAKQIILSAVSFLSGEEDNSNCQFGIEWNKDRLKKLIDIIGEPLLKKELTILFSQKYQDTSLIQSEIQRLQCLMHSIAANTQS